MDYFLEEAAGLRKTRAGSAEAPRAPRPPTSLPVVRARQSTRQRESTAVGRSPQSTPRASVARSVGFDTRTAACARHVAPPRPARPRGSRPGPACSLAARAPAPRSSVAWGGGSRAGDSQDAASLRHPLGCTKASSRAPHRGAGGSLTWAWPTPWGRSCLM